MTSHSNRESSQDSRKKQIKEKQVVPDIQMYVPRDTLSDKLIVKVCKVVEGFHCRPIAIRRSYEEIDKAIPLLVLCRFESWIRTDINAATRDIVADTAISLESVAVVVVVEKEDGEEEEEDIPTSWSIGKLQDEKYGKFGLIVGIEFTNRTLYRCPMNDQCFSSLRKFMEKLAEDANPVETNEGKSNKIPRLQVYCQINSDRVDKLYTAIGNELQGSLEEFEVLKLESSLDRKPSEPLLAIVESQSAVFKEFMASEDTPKIPTVLLILQDGCMEPTVENCNMLHLVTVDEKSENVDLVQTIAKQLNTLNEGELERLQD